MSAEVETAKMEPESITEEVDSSASVTPTKRENGISSAHSDAEDEDEIDQDDSVEEPKKKKIRSEKSSDTSKISTPSDSGRAKRESKKVDRFSQEVKKEEDTEVAEGWGTPLGEIVYINDMLNKFTADELKGLHRLAYGRPGTSHLIKRNMRKFKGFPFTRNDAPFEKKKASLEKFVSSDLKRILLLLGLERSGVKSELVERVLEFLLDPHDKGKPAPTPKRRKSKGKKGSKTGKKKARKSKSQPKKQSKTKKQVKEITDDSEAEAEDEDDEKEDEDDEKEEDESSESEQEEEKVEKPKKKTPAPSKKPQKTANKKTPQKAADKKTPQKAADKKTPQKAADKKTPKKTANKKTAPVKKVQKRPRTPSSSDSSNSDSDADVPLKKMVKKDPTEEDIASFIRDLLQVADLEEVTMKKLCQQVYDHYPGHDLSHKKEFIKDTVKKILT